MDQPDKGADYRRRYIFRKIMQPLRFRCKRRWAIKTPIENSPCTSGKIAYASSGFVRVRRLKSNNWDLDYGQRRFSRALVLHIRATVSKITDKFAENPQTPLLSTFRKCSMTHRQKRCYDVATRTASWSRLSPLRLPIMIATAVKFCSANLISTA